MKAAYFHHGTALLLFFLISVNTNSLYAAAYYAIDTCSVNELCQTAVLIPNVESDDDFVCIQGCNTGAKPDIRMEQCTSDTCPTVWFTLMTDQKASFLNITITGLDTIRPVFRIYRGFNNCSELTPVRLAQGPDYCAFGNGGIARANGTKVEPNAQYYIAVGGLYGTEGGFELCVNSNSTGSVCVLERNIEVTSRSGGGPLSGPFNPGETIGVCMEVSNYSAALNGCQWFQGLVPVFGNGWDPSSFDQNGQPLNATINGFDMGIGGNGLYGAATWDWFADVDYHFRDTDREIGDFDGNGTIDMCSRLYDSECPDGDGIMGGCCGPCWGAPEGDILPPGWFAYGINGSCATPGPPVSVDWGDGNTCGSGMGPWKFCFDLVIRGFPDCSQNQTTGDLSMGFFTFADGEIGSWTGEESVCMSDQPARLNLPLACFLQTDLGTEYLPPQCNGSTFEYTLDEPGIDYWTWSVNPSSAVTPSSREGDNGYTIVDTLYNTHSTPIQVLYTFTGYEENSHNTVIKRIYVQVVPDIQTTLPGLIYACEKNQDSLVISAEPFTGGLAPYAFLWAPGGETTPAITIFSPFQNTAVTLDMIDSIGCTYHKEVRIQVRPCLLDTIGMDDESNDTQTDEDPPHGGGNYSSPGVNVLQSDLNSQALKVYPVPATNEVLIEWPADADDVKELAILDLRGVQLYKATLSPLEKSGHRLRLDVDEYIDGVYLVILKTQERILTAKLVKM